MRVKKKTVVVRAVSRTVPQGGHRKKKPYRLHAPGSIEEFVEAPGRHRWRSTDRMKTTRYGEGSFPSMRRNVTPDSRVRKRVI